MSPKSNKIEVPSRHGSPKWQGISGLNHGQSAATLNDVGAGPALFAGYPDWQSVCCSAGLRSSIASRPWHQHPVALRCLLNLLPSRSIALTVTRHHAGLAPCFRPKASTHQPHRTSIVVTQGTYWSHAEYVMVLSCPALISEEDTRPMASWKTAKKIAATKIHKPISLHRRAAITAITKTAASMASRSPTGTR